MTSHRERRSESETNSDSSLFSCSCSKTSETISRRRRYMQIFLRTALLIGFYYCTSIGLTFYQKWLMVNFHFPFSVVTCHLVVKLALASLCRCILERKRDEKRVVLSWHDYLLRISPVGVTSALDIGLSNWSFVFINVSLYTMTKSTAIIFIAGFALLFNLEKKHWSLIVIAGMISSGLFLFTYHATQFRWEGFLMVLFASFLSGLRWTLSQLVMQRSELGLSNPIDMIYHVQPWMILTLLPFAIFLEGKSIIGVANNFQDGDHEAMLSQTLKIFAGAFLAFLMEVSEYLVVSYSSSLTLAVSGIFKEVITLGIAVYIAGDQLSVTNQIGLVVCLLGIIIHVTMKAKTIDQFETTTKVRENVLVMSPLLLNSEHSDSDDEEKRQQLEIDTEYILFQRDRDMEM
ncbi:solute carrier family 35 member C2-like [Artemia franciscana]|uniref:Sugar phosphate transporter domain-containing protein n=1 Tax=Artemia franciscana TaxID=6661 RepID=A0AA88LBT6_ARTSF|nr:hypothetical protein QYM36_000182 [Artemia franciscana]